MTGVKLSLMTFIQRNFRNETIPISCAVEKPKYIESRKEVIRKMDKEIKAAQDKMLEIGNPNDQAYQDAAKRLKKCQEIKKNCEDSIELITEQMAIEKSLVFIPDNQNTLLNQGRQIGDLDFLLKIIPL